MSSTSNSINERLNNYSTSLSNANKNGLDNGTLTETDAKIIRKVLIRIQTETELLNAIKKFNASFLNLDINYMKGPPSVLNNNKYSSAKLAIMLILLLA